MKIYYICAATIFITTYAIFHFGFRTGGAEQLYRINDQLAFEVQPDGDNYNGVSIHGFEPTGALINFMCGACQTDDETVFLINAHYRQGNWVFTDFPQHEHAPTDIVNLRTGETIEASVPADYKYGDDLSKLPEYQSRGLFKADENKLTQEYVSENKIMKIKICLLTLTFFAAAFGLSNTKTVSATGNPPPQNMISRCTVSDSTGTPLNVRSTPGGKKIVAKLKNGTVVYVENYSGDAKDQSWAEVRLKRSGKTKPLGWVLQDFLDCDL